jgi:putative effector of murein hydrolase
MMESLLSLPISGILVSIACYSLGVLVRKLLPSPFTNPLIISNILIILVIAYSPITIEQYNAGGNLISMFIGPATVILALRIYRQRAQLMANIVPILGSCIAGSAASLLSVWFLCRLFRIDKIITMSMLPKSVTTAIALELSGRAGGLSGLAVAAVIMTGMTSASFSPFFIKIFKLRDPNAAGLAIGASGHAIGTATAIELGETEGAMSGLAMSVSGIISAIIFLLLFPAR